MEPAKASCSSSSDGQAHNSNQLDMSENATVGFINTGFQNSKLTQQVHYHLDAHTSKSTETGTSKNDALMKLKTALATIYTEWRMTGLPWLDDVNFSLEEYFVDLEMRTEEKSDVTKSVKLEDFFQCDSREAMKKKPILIEGGPGYGKSTLVAKILYDWGKGQEEYVREFDLALLISLRHLTGSVEESLVSSLVDLENEDESVIRSLLSDKNLRLLLLMDGFDELPKEYEEQLYEFLEKKTYGHHFQIIITSRPGRLALDKKLNLNKIMGGSAGSVPLKGLFGKMITVIGISKKNRDRFLDLYLKSCELPLRKNVMSSVKELVDSDMLECPLFLLMMVVIFGSHESHSPQIKTKTDLYKSLHDHIVKRFITNLDLNADVSDFTLFEKENEFTTVLFQLGKLAWDALKENRVTFSEKELLDVCEDINITKLGLFTANVSCSGPARVRKTVYQPVHKSMQEFWASFYLWHSFKKSPPLFLEDTLSIIHVHKLIRDCEYANLTFPFLSGLLGNDVGSFFSMLVPFVDEIAPDFEATMFTILKECTFNCNDALSQLKGFFPITWMIHQSEDDKSFLVSLNHKVVLDYALRFGKTTVIMWHLYMPVNFPSVVKVDTFFLVLETYDWYNCLLFLINVQVECISLVCKIRYIDYSWHNFKKLIEHFKFEEISFDILSGCISQQWLSMIFSDDMRKLIHPKRINLLKCQVNILDSAMVNSLVDLVSANVIHRIYLDLAKTNEPDWLKKYEYISTLVELRTNAPRSDEKLKKLCRLYLNSEGSEESEESKEGLEELQNWGKKSSLCMKVHPVQEKFDNLLHAAAKSDCLKYIAFHEIPGKTKFLHLPTVDLSKLFYGGKKSWECLKFDGKFQVTCTNAIQTSCETSVKVLDISMCEVQDSAINFLQSVKVTNALGFPNVVVQKSWFRNKLVRNFRLHVNYFTSRSQLLFHEDVLPHRIHLDLVFMPGDFGKWSNQRIKQIKENFSKVLPRLETLELHGTHHNILLAAKLLHEVKKHLLTDEMCGFQKALMWFNDDVETNNNIRTVLRLFQIIWISLPSTGHLSKFQVVLHNRKNVRTYVVDTLLSNELKFKCSDWVMNDDDSPFAKTILHLDPNRPMIFEITERTDIKPKV